MGTTGDKMRLGFLLLAIVLNVWPVGSAPRSDTAGDRDWTPAPDASEAAPGSGPVDSSSLGASVLPGGVGEEPMMPGQTLARLQMYDFDKDADARWTLPKQLDEISGLATTADGRLLAHGDEFGVVFVLDRQKEKTDKVFTLSNGGSVVKDDFEGIAVVGDRIYLVTSAGRIYECSEGADGSQVAFRVHETGLGATAEIEGLAYDPNTQALLLARKEYRGAGTATSVAIYSWSLAAQRLVDAAPLEIALSALCAGTEHTQFHASGIECDPASGHYFLVAARQALVAEVTNTGEVIAVRELPAKRHRQAEGITFTNDGALVISDEAAGKKATLTVYPVARH